MTRDPATPRAAAPDCATKLKALADGTRLAVMESLMAGPLHVGELAKRLGVEQSLLSHHLRILRELGLLVARRDGKAVLYAVAPKVAEAGSSLDLGCCRLSFDTPSDAMAADSGEVAGE